MERENSNRLHTPHDGFNIFQEYNNPQIQKWINAHYYCGIAVIVAGCILEFLGYFVLMYYHMVASAPEVYFLKYLLVPTGLNALLFIGAYFLMRATPNMGNKATIVSVMLILMVFVVYTIHMHYNSIGAGFAAAIMSTIIYGNTKITTISGVTAFFTKLISDLFLVYDPNFKPHRIDSDDSFLNFVVSMIGIIGIYALSIIVLRIEKDKQSLILTANHEKLRLAHQVVIDDLTGIYNRTGLRNAFDRILEESSAHIILAMIDMDHFKEINDTYGHGTGDDYLRELGGLLQQLSSSNIQAFRYGGDEFCLIFKNVSMVDAERTCKVLQSAYLKSAVCGKFVPMTLSIGMVESRELERPSELIHMADSALYRAKKNRGTITIAR